MPFIVEVISRQVSGGIGEVVKAGVPIVDRITDKSMLTMQAHDVSGALRLP